MRVLVTGGAGFIGSVVAAELVQAGHTVCIYDNLIHGHRKAVIPSAEFVLGDVADRKTLEETLRRFKIEAVLHFAALIEAGESMQAPEKYFRNNSAGTLSLIESMLACGVRKLVFSSTAALYGEPKRTPIEESAVLRPTNVYGESKLIAESMLAWFSRIHGMRYASLRYFNAAGATVELGEDHRPESHLIPNILQVAMGKRESVSIFGSDYPTHDGTCIRDYIHVTDLASAHILALVALDEHPCLIYNLGNGRGFSVREVIQTARKITGHKIPVVEAPRRPGDPAVLVASSEKIKRELGWKPRFPTLDAIIASTWQWYQKFPEGYQ